MTQENKNTKKWSKVVLGLFIATNMAGNVPESQALETFSCDKINDNIQSDVLINYANTIKNYGTQDNYIEIAQAYNAFSNYNFANYQTQQTYQQNSYRYYNNYQVPTYTPSYNSDSSKNNISQPQFDNVSSFSTEGLAAVKKAEKYGYIDKTGKIIIQPQFDDAYSFHEGLAKVTRDKKYEFIDKTGKITIQPQFDYADSFKEGLAQVKKDGKSCYIDKTGKITIQP